MAGSAAMSRCASRTPNRSAQPLCFHEGFHEGSYLYKKSEDLKGLAIFEGDDVSAEHVGAHILGDDVGHGSGHCYGMSGVLDQDGLRAH